MLERLPLRGTMLNTTTVFLGAALGIWLGDLLPARLQSVALVGLGLVTLVLALQMALKTKSIPIVASAIVLGGVIGTLAGIDVGLAHLAESARKLIGGGDHFNEGLVTATILFCVGPMTLLGCLQDGLEHKIELLAVKSLMDGVAAVFLAATLGLGVLFSALAVLVIQGSLTLLARPLKPLARDERLLREAGATGGAILLAIAFGLLGIAKIPAEVFLPALLLAPAIVAVTRQPDTPT